MNNWKNIDKKIFDYLKISKRSKVYYSNIWYIIVSDKYDFVYKIFTDKYLFDKELYAYNLLVNNVKIPEFEVLDLLKNFFVLKLENIRKDYKRKNNILDLDIKKIALILWEIHSIKKNWNSFILWDIHSSNFYEINNWNNIELWIFDFSSSKYGYIEEDLANFYIDIWLNDLILNEFLLTYTHKVYLDLIYKYAIKELYERIKNWMNLSLEKKKMYYKCLLVLQNKTWKLKNLD